MFICKLECSINESKLRNLIFEILKQSKIRKRLEFLHVFGNNLECMMRA